MQVFQRVHYRIQAQMGTGGLQIGYDVHGGKALGNTLNGTPHQKLKPQCGAAAVDDIDVVIFCFFFGDLSALAGAGERCRQQHADHGVARRLGGKKVGKKQLRAGLAGGGQFIGRCQHVVKTL